MSCGPATSCLAEASRTRQCEGCARPRPVCLCDVLPSPRLRARTRIVILRHPREGKRRVVASADLLALCFAKGAVTIVDGLDASSLLAMTEEQGLEQGQGQKQKQERKKGHRWLLLWPGAKATPLEELVCCPPLPPKDGVLLPSCHPRPTTTLLVLDGTWHEAKSLYNANAAVLDSLCTQVTFSAAAPDTHQQGEDTAEAAVAEKLREAAIGGAEKTHMLLPPPNVGIYEEGVVVEGEGSFIRLQPRAHFLSTLECVAQALRVLEGEPRSYSSLCGSRGSNGGSSGMHRGGNSGSSGNSSGNGGSSRGTGIASALHRVFAAMNTRQRHYYTTDRAKAPGRRHAEQQRLVAPATLTQPPSDPLNPTKAPLLVRAPPPPDGEPPQAEAGDCDCDRTPLDPAAVLIQVRAAAARARAQAGWIRGGDYVLVRQATRPDDSHAQVPVGHVVFATYHEAVRQCKAVNAVLRRPRGTRFTVAKAERFTTAELEQAALKMAVASCAGTGCVGEAFTDARRPP